MYDYDARYRHLKEAGFSGWAGCHYDRGLARLRESLDCLVREGVLAKPPARLLELGCGNGMASALMAPLGYEVHGVDISPAAIAWAQERFAETGLGGSFRQGSVCAMPWFGDSFSDIVIDGNCLHCLIGDDRGRCLAEVRRILVPGGVFIVSSMCGDPRSEEARSRFDSGTGCLMEDGEPYRTLKSLPLLMRELIDAGFAVQGSSVSVNPWWDHATLICRVKNDPVPPLNEQDAADTWSLAGANCSPTRASFETLCAQRGAFLIGGPKAVIERIVALDQTLGGVSRVTFQVSTALWVHDAILRSIELVGTAIAPALRDVGFSAKPS